MTKEEILEGNKLIAEFMGYIKKSSDKDFTFYEHPDGKGIVLQSHYDYKKFNSHQLMEVKGFIFHRSWDWLMPVVEKIESTRDYYVKIYGNQAYVQCKVMADTTILTSQKYVAGSAYTEENTKLSNTWSAIVEYIKFYNEKCSK